MYQVKEEIENKIDMLEQPYRNVLYYKYIKGLSLTKVANEINYDYDYTRKIYGTALLKYKEHTKKHRITH